MAIVQFSLRNKTRLGALRVRDKVLLLQGMLWADEVREVEFAGTKSRAKIGEKELELSAALVEQYASDFTPEEFEDEYQLELRELIDAKLEAGDTLDTDATEGKAAPDGAAQADDDSDDAEVIDLMEALKSSLDRKAGGSGSKKSTSKKSGSSSKSGSGSSGGSGSKKSTSKKKSTSSKKSSGSTSKSA